MTRTRYVVLALISGCVTINYLDRALLGISIPTIRQQFDLHPAAVVPSAFFWSYFLAQIPSGDALYFVGVVALAGACSWIFVVGDIRPLVGSPPYPNRPALGS